MAVKPEKIKERLKALFPKANLSKERLDALAAKLANKPADDADDAAIDEVLNNANDFMSFDEIAKSDDRTRTLEAKAKGKDTPPGSEPTPEPEDNDTPAWAKTLIKDISDLKAGKVTEGKQQTAAKQFESSEVLKGLKPEVKERWLKRLDVNSETSIEDQIKELETEYNDTYQHLANTTPVAGKPPMGGGAPKADEELIKNVVKNIIPN